MPKTTPREKRVAMGAAIVFWRRKRDMQQKVLAEACGWLGGRVSNYERGKSWPEEESVETLARELKIPPEDLRQTHKLLYNHMLAVEGKVGPEQEAAVVGPLVSWIEDTAAWASMDLDRRWKELHRLEGMVRAFRDQVEQDTHKEQIRSVFQSKGKS